MGAGGVGFIEFGADLAVGIGGPDDLFKVANEFVAAWVDEEAGFAGSALEAAIDAIYTVAHGRIGGIGMDFVHKVRHRSGEELAN